jgi:hypothetical protein
VSISVDISEIVAMEERARAELARVPRIMKAVADVGAAEERSTHGYQNRTGELQKNTRAVIANQSADGATVELEMAKEYASYVIAKGLSNIDEEARRVERGITVALEALGKRITR